MQKMHASKNESGCNPCRSTSSVGRHCQARAAHKEEDKESEREGERGRARKTAFL